MQSTYRESNKGTFIMNKDDIEFEAECILVKYDKDILTKPQPTPIELIIEDQGLDLVYKRLSIDLSTLGAMVFNKGYLEVYEDGIKKLQEFNCKTIIIDSKMVETNDKRLPFTYAHELGHYITQYELEHENENQLSLDLFSKEDKMIASICKRETANESMLPQDKKKLETKVDWQEWQANYFASAILLPKQTLDIYLDAYFKDYNVMSPETLLGKLSKDELDVLTDNIAKTYGVSNEMTFNRLKSLGYI